MENKSGWRVNEFKVLVKPDVLEEKTKGGIIIPDSIKEDWQTAKCEALIVAVGAKAFDYDSEEEKPKVGDKVLIPTYAGRLLTEEQTTDRQQYRIIMDREILAIRKK